MIAERMVGKSLGKGVFDITREVKEAEAEYGKENVINSTIGTFYGEDENLSVLNTVEKIYKNLFDITREVKEAEAEYGKENVINSTIGTFYGEDENLSVLNTVEKIYKNLPAAELFGYAPGISGSKEYKEAVKENVFDIYKSSFDKSFIGVTATPGGTGAILFGYAPGISGSKEYKEAVKENVFDIYKSSFDKSFIGVTATPGGTGAIHNTLKAYMDCGETVLLPEFMWEAYKHLAAANGLKFDTYSLFDGDGFNLSSFSEKVLKMVKKQHKVLAVINDPCQNPTGYSLSLEEWKAVVEILKEAAKYGEVILLDDIAYLDYDFSFKFF